MQKSKVEVWKKLRDHCQISSCSEFIIYVFCFFLINIFDISKLQPTFTPNFKHKLAFICRK